MSYRMPSVYDEVKLLDTPRVKKKNRCQFRDYDFKNQNYGIDTDSKQSAFSAPDSTKSHFLTPDTAGEEHR